MEPGDEKDALEKETLGTQEQSDTQEQPDTQIRVDPPEDRQREGGPSDPEKDAIEKETETETSTPDPKRLSAAGDLEGRAKRESVESRAFGSVRDSSVLSDSDFGEFDDVANRPSDISPQTAARPQHSRGETMRSVVSTTSRRSGRSLPPLRRKETKLAQKEAHPWQHLGITLGLPMIILFDLVVPCIVYYTWYDAHKSDWETQCREQYRNRQCPIPKPEYDKDILGYAIICFGFGELWILIARVWRLLFRQEECAPLLSRSRWELDATSWVYGVAMILALIPFVIGSSLELPHLYLYSPSFIMGFLGILMVITTFVPFKLPIGINSQARGTRLRPFIYYAAEDFMAVDGLQDREFRIRYNERYETNKMFRRFFLYLTLWWLLGVVIYIGCVSAVIWNLEFHYAFGVSFGILFSYIAIWAVATVIWVKIEMKREHLAYEKDEIEP